MEAYFDKLRQNLELSPTFSGIIQTRHAAVREQLAQDSILIGSLQRKTRIQPLSGQAFDIDILVRLGEFSGWIQAGGITAHAAVQQLLQRARQSERYAVKNPVADEPTVTLSFQDNVRVELVPAYVDQAGFNSLGVPHSPKGRAFWVPDGKGGWQLADYLFDAEYITKLNDQMDGYLVPTIKVLKAIKRLHFSQLKSFALEILAAQTLGFIVREYQQRGLRITYPPLLQFFFNTAAVNLSSVIAIPGSLSPPIVISTLDASTTAGAFTVMYGLMAGMSSLNERDQIERWRAIIGDPFPTRA